MPRNVRNFWLEADIDGRDSTLASGPRGADGGMSATLFVRDNGRAEPALYISATANGDGTLTIAAMPASAMAGKITTDGGFGFIIETER